MMCRLLRWLCVAIFTLASVAHAHDRTTSYSSWAVSKGSAKVTLTMSDTDVNSLRLEPGDDALLRYATEHLGVLAGEQRCALIGQPSVLASALGRRRVEWAISIPERDSVSIRSDLFYTSIPGHLHFASLHLDAGVTERVLTDSERVWQIKAAHGDGEVAATSFAGYWAVGVEHIVTGYDHLVFLFALLLSGGSFRTLVKVVTGFTIGHSITLALAALRIIRPESAAIEALIGLSIALVAVENVYLIGRRDWLLPVLVIFVLAGLGVGSAAGYGRISSLSWLGLMVFLSCYYPLLLRSTAAESSRWAVALIFGLVHGFGFASVLLEAELPTEHLVAALVGFNLGVESGQIALVVIAWPLLRYASSRWGNVVVEVGSAVALSLGIFWMIGRNFG